VEVHLDAGGRRMSWSSAAGDVNVAVRPAVGSMPPPYDAGACAWASPGVPAGAAAPSTTTIPARTRVAPPESA
jgi:hypothetical protein